MEDAPHILGRLQEKLPNAVLRYVVPLLALGIATIPVFFAYHHAGTPNVLLRGILSIVLLLILLGAAWLGFGPGLIVCVLVTFLIPHWAANAPPPGQATVVQFALLAIISLLVSRIASGNRHREADLRRAAVDLEARVRERTAQAVQAAAAAREQADLLDLAHDAIMALDWDGTIRFWNRGAEQMYGWTREEALTQDAHQLLQTVFPEPLEQIARKVSDAGHWEGELQHTSRDGTRLTVASRWALRKDAEGRPCGYLEITTDISEKRRIEEQLRHTQKLESLGVLAGGVAHDFNNLLTGILGNASLALDSTMPHHPNRVLLEEVMRAAERAADLTRQLLAYAGKGRFVLRTIDLSELVREIGSLVQTSIPKSVQLRLQLADDLPGIEADPGQLQQIVMNLVINGAEAIGPEGGSVLVRTAVQQVDEQYIHTIATAPGANQLKPGQYVTLEVHDTGCGMSQETIGKIFDPFFTTKFTGRGLGLSAVLGIVRGHKGALKVYSRPGQGTSFKVLVPASGTPSPAVPSSSVGDLAGTGTVLVVDDEEIVRHTAQHALRRYGYSVLLAEDGAKALELYRREPENISLVLLDLTMPVMSGEETLRQLQRINPKVRVLLTSGYNEVEAVQRFAGKGLAGFIQKPYTSAELGKKVKEVLAG